MKKEKSGGVVRYSIKPKYPGRDLVWLEKRKMRVFVDGAQMTTASLRGWLGTDRMQRHRQSRPLPHPLGEGQGAVSVIRLSRG